MRSFLAIIIGLAIFLPASTHAAVKCTVTEDCNPGTTNTMCVYTKFDPASKQFDTASGMCLSGSAVSSMPDCDFAGIQICSTQKASTCVGIISQVGKQPASGDTACLPTELIIVTDTAEKLQQNSAAAQETILAATINYEQEKEAIEATYQSVVTNPQATEQQKIDALVAREQALKNAAIEHSVVIGAISKTLKESTDAALSEGALAVAGATQPTSDLPLPATLNVPIPGVVFSNPADIAGRDDAGGRLSIPYIGQYIAGVFQYSLYVLAGLAVFVIIFAGVRWILARGNASEIKDAKEMITGSFIGLMIALLSYSMLQIIDPRLTTLSPIGLAQIEATEFKFELSAQVYQQVTGGKPLDLSSGGRAQNAATAATAAQNLGIPPCLAQVIVKHESGGNPAVIGHDENYCGPNYVGSRFAFLRTEKTYKGVAFESTIPSLIPPSSDKSPQAKALRKKISCESHKNDDGGKNIDATTFVPPDFGLDWRFTHGFGLGQVTFGDGHYCNVNGQQVRGIKIKGLNNRCVTVPELISVDTAVEAMAGRLLSWYKKAGGVPGTPQNQVPESVIRLTFAHYGKGNDPGDLYRDSVNGRVKHYLECVKGTGSSAPETSTGEKLSDGLPAAEE